MKDSIAVAKKVASIVERPVFLTDMMGNVRFATNTRDKTKKIMFSKEDPHFVEEPYHFFRLKNACRHYLVLDLEKPLAGETLELLKLFLSWSEDVSEEDKLLKYLLLGEKSGKIVDDCRGLLHEQNGSQWTLIGFFGQSPENMPLLKKTVSHYFEEVWCVEPAPEELTVIVRKKDADALDEAFKLRDIIIQEAYYDPVICISHSVGKIEHLSKAYDHLARLFDVVKNEAGGAYYFGDYVFEIFMNDVDGGLVKDTYMELYGDCEKVLGDKELLLTVKTFLEENLNINETSRRLYIHRNTLIYRINKVYEMTSMDLRHFRDALKMNMILKMKKSVDGED